MYPRFGTLPSRSFFLLGPRGTGKTTWLRSILPQGEVRWYDLLDDRELARLVRSPEVFRAEVRALPSNSWVVVDEVQRLPDLLRDVHGLLTEHPEGVRFALTGSSARKLRRAGVDLLPGRVVHRRFFPLTLAERGPDLDIDEALRFGGLPAVVSEPDLRGKAELLTAYVDAYLTQEIRLDSTVKSLATFGRFLDVAALCNAATLNVTALSRDSAVARTTVQGYFETLADTLVGSLLPAWSSAVRVRESKHPKWYFFDPGVVRAITGRLHDRLLSEERGRLLETLIRGELEAAIDGLGSGGRLAYWGLPSETEVDFIWHRSSHATGIEVKASERWRSEFGRGLTTLLDDKKIERGIVVYLGRHPMRVGEIDVLPLADFVRKLWAGELFSPPEFGPSKP